MDYKVIESDNESILIGLTGHTNYVRRTGCLCMYVLESYFCSVQRMGSFTRNYSYFFPIYGPSALFAASLQPYGFDGLTLEFVPASYT